MTNAERTQWMSGTRKQSAALSDAVQSGAFCCDECSETAKAISHQGADSTARVECPAHYLARIRAERMSRPSGAELAACVTRSVEV